MRFALPLAVIFFVAVTASTVHNFFGSNTKTIYFADSRNYLASSAYYSKFFTDTLKGKPPLERIQDEGLRAKLICDGPVLSGIFGAVYTILGRAPAPDDWKTIVFIQSVIHGLSACMTACLSWLMLHRRRYAFFVGVFYALYPAALITAGRFMTETLGCLLVSAFLVGLFASRRLPAIGFLTGLLAGAAWTMKVLLAPPVVLTAVSAIFLKRLKPLSIALLLAGFVVAVGTWVGFSHHYLGRAMITTERAAVHNAFIGWDTETDGFQASAPTVKEKAFLSSTPLAAMFGQIFADPSGSINLVAKKLTRLYGYPFNDFRHSVFGMSYQVINAIHWFYIFSCLAGILFYSVRGYRLFDKLDQEKINLALIFLFCMQGCFMVEGSARYGFSTLPFMCLFSGIGWFIAASWLRSGDIKQLFSLGAAGVAATALIVSMEPLVSKFSAYDPTITVQPGTSVTALIELHLPAKNSLQKHSLIVIDGDKGLNDCKVKVNGHALPQSPVALALLDSILYSQFNVMKDYGYGLGVEIDDLPQWRAVFVPTEFIKLSGPNKIQIEPQMTAAKININEKPEERRFRDLRVVSVNRVLNAPSGLEARPFSPILSSNCKKAFLTSSTQRNEAMMRATALKPLRVYIGLLSEGNLENSKAEVGLGAKPLPAESFPVATPGKFVHDFVQKDFPLFCRVANTNELTISKYVANHSFTHSTIPIPDYSALSHIKVTLTGEIRSVSDNGRAGLAVTTSPKNDYPWFLARLPYFVKANKQWQKFEISDLAPHRIFSTGIASVSVGLYPGPWPEVAGVGPSVSGPQIFLRNLRLEVEPVDLYDVHGKNILMN